MKQLERIYFLQGHRCFFCGQAIPEGEASIEHLVAAANGGSKDDENCVVCCKSVNLALGHLSVKAKLQAVLNQQGAFACPLAGARLGVVPTDSGADRLQVVIADLRKRGSARPRRVATLKNTMNAAFQMTLSEAELDTLLRQLEAKGFVLIEGVRVTYSLPSQEM